ncbi:hypothetical protein QKW61_014235, partial [Staphylococcus nepalensis]|nr:hypothetical protein [Staphylococcus nepalensis]
LPPGTIRNLGVHAVKRLAEEHTPRIEFGRDTAKRSNCIDEQQWPLAVDQDARKADKIGGGRCIDEFEYRLPGRPPIALDGCIERAV